MRKKREKKKKVTAIKISKTEKPEVVKLPKVTKEEKLVVKQPFTDPTKEVVFAPIPSVEDLKVELENREKLIDAIPYDDKQRLKIVDTVMELPAPLMTPTNRQYGEQFLPDYIRVRNKLRRLAGLS